MADSLFDNRYRYDYIYPRGRSGETLRAVDTQDNDRPVVIKRPAPNDAPPIRAGQEVSILNERKALQKLAGHPVATALVGGGQFLAGGTAHQYIVMERGQGVLVADMVRELAPQEHAYPNWKCWSFSTACSTSCKPLTAAILSTTMWMPSICSGIGSITHSKSLTGATLFFWKATR